MLEISPVVAGTFDAPDYAPAHDLASSTEDASGVDARRYTNFDRSITETASVDFSFHDLLDTVNPLQHLPVVGSIYRAVTGDEIKPAARVMGDILYGAAMGGVSAAMSGVSAVADAALEAETGKDSGGLVLAALFGSDGDKTTQVAATDAAAPSATASVADTKKSATPVQFASAMAPAAAPVLAAANALQTATPAAKATAPAALQATPLLAGAETANSLKPLPGQGETKWFPLKNVPRQNAGIAASPSGMQAQDLAMALSSASPGMKLGHTIYTNKLMNGPHPMPVGAFPPVPQAPDSTTVSAVAAQVASATPPQAARAQAATGAALAAIGGTANLQSRPVGAQQSQMLAPDLEHEMMLRSLQQYRSIEAGLNAPAPGGAVDITN